MLHELAFDGQRPSLKECWPARLVPHYVLIVVRGKRGIVHLPIRLYSMSIILNVP
jgi:hypothetical protein